MIVKRGKQVVVEPVSIAEFRRIAALCLRDRTYPAAYAEAESCFSPAQMGALHRQLREKADADYYADAMVGLP